MILIKDGRVIDPERQIDDVLDLQIEGGRILKIGKYHRSEEYQQIIEAKGLIVAPGLVGVNEGTGKHLTGNPQEAARGGYTTIVARPVPQPDDLKSQCLVETVTAGPAMQSNSSRYRIIEGLKDGSVSRIGAEHLETALALGITSLVHKGHLTVMELIEKMSFNPARFYGLDCGAIEEGAGADLVVFSDTERWKVGAGSPFAGLELYGKVHYTISSGTIIYGTIIYGTINPN